MWILLDEILWLKWFIFGILLKMSTGVNDDHELVQKVVQTSGLWKEWRTKYGQAERYFPLTLPVSMMHTLGFDTIEHAPAVMKDFHPGLKVKSDVRE